MKVFELLPRPLGSIFRGLAHFTCNSPRAMKPPPPLQQNQNPSKYSQPAFAGALVATLCAIAVTTADKSSTVQIRLNARSSSVICPYYVHR